ncbi:uncharacterized protein LOC130545112 [Triplophysa rosa]|uniref:Immunoglobulin V-set domain-containing protein n=1 Tax=Triplophysa rosa TaxID=992332 RepID=A0A9W7WB90_TRIRA|nr:uncharacterized protein LOC130545112 [Triplophysa rosa]KAI7794552.1 hypothetical protein IRJ41_015353 [Triplophysa rosa]
MLRRRSHLVLFLTEVLVCFCGTWATMNVKNALEGETVKETILKCSALGKDDQLMAYFQENSASNGRELCAQYFCDHGKCVNDPASVGQFQEQDGDVVLVIQNVNITNSGQYSVSHNGVRDVCNFTLDVQEATGQKKENITETEMPQSSVSTWSVSVIAVVLVIIGALVLVIIGVLCCTKKKIMNSGTKPAAEEHELKNLKTART